MTSPHPRQGQRCFDYLDVRHVNPIAQSAHFPAQASFPEASELWTRESLAAAIKYYLLRNRERAETGEISLVKFLASLQQKGAGDTFAGEALLHLQLTQAAMLEKYGGGPARSRRILKSCLLQIVNDAGGLEEGEFSLRRGGGGAAAEGRNKDRSALKGGCNDPGHSNGVATSLRLGVGTAEGGKGALPAGKAVPAAGPTRSATMSRPATADAVVSVGNNPTSRFQGVDPARLTTTARVQGSAGGTASENGETTRLSLWGDGQVTSGGKAPPPGQTLEWPLPGDRDNFFGIPESRTVETTKAGCERFTETTTYRDQTWLKPKPVPVPGHQSTSYMYHQIGAAAGAAGRPVPTVPKLAGMAAIRTNNATTTLGGAEGNKNNPNSNSKANAVPTSWIVGHRGRGVQKRPDTTVAVPPPPLFIPCVGGIGQKHSVPLYDMPGR